MQSPIKKTHLIDLFISENDISVCTSLLDYLEGEKPLDSVHVPGSTATHLVCKGFAKRITKRILKWILKLGKAGWSLFGKLTAKDFWVTPLQQIKVSSKRLDDLMPSTREGTRADMRSVGQVIRGMFSAGKKGKNDIPYNFKHLLRLLKNYKKIYALILEHHPAGMSEYRCPSEGG